MGCLYRVLRKMVLYPQIFHSAWLLVYMGDIARYELGLKQQKSSGRLTILCPLLNVNLKAF